MDDADEDAAPTTSPPTSPPSAAKKEKKEKRAAASKKKKGTGASGTAAITKGAGSSSALLGAAPTPSSAAVLSDAAANEHEHEHEHEREHEHDDAAPAAAASTGPVDASLSISPATPTTTTESAPNATTTTAMNGVRHASDIDALAAAEIKAAPALGKDGSERRETKHDERRRLEVEKAESQAKKLGYFGLYRYSDWRDKTVVFIGALMSMVHGALTPIFSVIFGQFIDAFTDPASLVASINKVAVWFLILGAISFVSTFIQAWSFSYVGKRQADRIRRRYFQSVLRQEIGWYDLNDSSQMTSRVASNVLLIQEAMSEQVGTFLQYTTSCLVGFLVGFIYGWQLTLVILALVPPLAVGGIILGKLTSRLSAQVQAAHASAGGAAEEVISCVRTVVAFGGEQTEIDRYDGLLGSALDAGKRKAHFHGIGLGGVFFAAFSSFGLAFWYGSVLVSQGHATAGDVLVVFFSIVVGATSIGSAAPAMQAFTAGTGAAAHIFEMIERVPAIDAANEGGDRLPEGYDPTIRLESVDFAYPSRADVPISRQLSIELPAGKTVALVGFSGSGKSTVVALIERFYDPVSGRVTLGGRDVRELNVRWLRSQMALVQQEPILFNLTIGKNIAYGMSEGETATQEQIEAAARQANAHDFISRLPLKYDTIVGERGVQLSGGQKQRIAIARALIRNPRILLLDEATSALDTASERVVQDALDRARAGRSVCVIAHRLSTIRDADLIYVMDRGSVVESGTWAELTSRPSRFAELVEAQAVRGATSGGATPARRDGDATLSGASSPSLAVLSLPASGDSDAAGVSHTAADLEAADAIIGATTMMAPAGLLRGAALEATAASTGETDGATATAAAALGDEKGGDEKGASKGKGGKKPQRKAKSRNALWRALRMNAPEWYLLTLGILGGAGHGAILPCFSVIFSNILGVLIVMSIPGGDTQTERDKATFWALMFVVLGVGSGIANYFQSAMLNVSGDRLARRIRSLLFANIMRQDLPFFDHPDNGVGRLTTKLATDAITVEQSAGLRFGITAEIFSALFTGLFISLWACWQLALIILACFPLLLAGSAARTSLRNGFAASTKKAYEASGQIASEAVLAIRTVAALGREPTFLAVYSERVENAAATSKTREILSAVAFALADFFNYPIWALAFWEAGQLVSGGGFVFTDVMTALMAIIFGAVSVGRLATISPNVGAAAVAAEDIFEIIDRVPAITALAEGGDELPADFEAKFTVEDVDFAYPTRPTVQVANKLTLDFPAGKTVALVGSSGSGKSTVIQLLERFYDPAGGRITLAGRDLRELSVRWLRSQMGLVQQEPILFARSILENITYGKPSATMAEVEAAARKANIHNFIMSLPEKYDTFAGDRGAQLSGGQKQRIAIARAILRDPKILLLDEATSALDSESEKLVQAALDQARAGRTCVTIAHRLSTIQDADNIFVMERGSLRESGTHDALMTERGLYSALVNSQALSTL